MAKLKNPPRILHLHVSFYFLESVGPSSPPSKSLLIYPTIFYNQIIIKTKIIIINLTELEVW